MSKIVMGYWDCENCGQSVPGKLRTCPSCSHSRGAEVKFYMKDVEFLSDEEAAKIGKKPDWLCDYCGSYNNDANLKCVGCGAVRGSDNKDYFDNNTTVERSEKKDESQWECAYCGALNDASADHCSNCKAERCEKQKETAAPKKKANPFPLFAVLLGIIGLVVLAFIIAKPKKLEATVNSIAWETTVYVEELTEKTDKTTNRNNMPEGAVIFKTESEEYTEREKVGTHIEIEYKDLGNGTFEQIEVEVDDYDDVVKYRDIYHYSYKEWTVVNNVKKTGNGLNYEFADAVLSDGQRVRTESNRVQFKITVTNANGEQKTYQAEEEIAKKLVEGKAYTLGIRDDKIVEVK